MILKNEKGSITIFVLVGLLFMTAFLIIAYGSNVNNSKIVKEQFNIISDIYMPNDNIVESYTEAYTDLRAKKKQILTKSVEYSSQVEVEKCYADDIVNYQIYGSENGLGKEIVDPNNINFGKFRIIMRIRDIENDAIIDETTEYQEETYNIYLDEELTYQHYIDYKTGKIYNVDTQQEEGTIKDLPKLITYEDYTNIEIYEDENEELDSQDFPSKIIIDYVGYTFEEEEQNEN